MKILDITQRSQVQHIAEGREKLDELLPQLAGAAIGGGLSYAMLVGEHGFNPLNWPTVVKAQFALDVGIGAATMGVASLAGAGVRAAAKYAAKATGEGAKAAVKNIGNKAKTITNKITGKPPAKVATPGQGNLNLKGGSGKKPGTTSNQTPTPTTTPKGANWAKKNITRQVTKNKMKRIKQGLMLSPLVQRAVPRIGQEDPKSKSAPASKENDPSVNDPSVTDKKRDAPPKRKGARWNY